MVSINADSAAVPWKGGAVDEEHLGTPDGEKTMLKNASWWTTMTTTPLYLVVGGLIFGMVVIGAAVGGTLATAAQSSGSAGVTNNTGTDPPTVALTTSPTFRPSMSPSTSNPSLAPSTSKPSSAPSSKPSIAPSTSKPSTAPLTSKPSTAPLTSKPSTVPSSRPSIAPSTSKPSTAPLSSRPSVTPSKAPTFEAPRPDRIKMGGLAVLQVNRGGFIQSWGRNSQLGIGVESGTALVATNVSAPLQGLEVISIGAGFESTCVVTAEYRFFCWGLLSIPAVSGETVTTQTVPREIAFPSFSVIQVISLLEARCFLASNFRIYCWGVNSVGQLGLGNNVNKLDTPGEVLLPTGMAFKQISGAMYSSCALSFAGDVYCWGSNSFGQLGVPSAGSQDFRATPLRVEGIPGPVKELVVGRLHGFARLETGQIYGWGQNDDFQLGNNGSMITGSLRLITVMPNEDIFLIKPCLSGTLAVLNNGTLWGWGSMFYGDGQFSERQEPVLILTEPAGEIVDIACPQNSFVTCVRFATKPTKCWGSRFHYLIGDGINDQLREQLTPAEVING